MRSLVPGLLLGFLSTGMAYGYAPDTVRIHSQILQEDRLILLYRSFTESNRDSAKIIYMLDGEFSDYRFNLLANADSLHDWIGIGIVNNDRRKDLLAINRADSFLRFLKMELIPTIEKEQKISSRVLFGHSIAGGFILYAMLREPGLFDTYLASSPTPMREMVNPASLKAMDKRMDKCCKFYFSCGSKDMTQVKKWNSYLLSTFASINLKNISWKREVFDYANHNASAGIAIVHGTQW